MGRHPRKRGFGHFGAGFLGGTGFGGSGFRIGRKLASNDLQLVLLALLAEQPSHGYELIRALEERSGGFYSPSPGMIYPALTYLEEIGHATVEPEGARKLYRITGAGRTHLAQNRAVADAVLAELERIGSKMEHVRRAFAGERPSPDDWAGESLLSPDHERLALARRELKKALHDTRHCSAQEAKRIADILHRAAEEILGKK
jgi:DNA-binding PadR family transcriptional regulator